MLQALQEWWAGILGGGVVSAMLGWVGVDTVRTVRRHEREKADRKELADLVKKVEDGHTALLERIDASNDKLVERIDNSAEEGANGRRDLHQKVEGYMKEQNRINLEVARYMRQNGNH